ncbi:hypothetical protein ACFLZR_00800 [Candidatus Neomarinimicrobiota bacterium]
MSNETYLTASYFVTGLAATGLAAGVWLYLRRPFGETMETIPARPFGGILRRLLVPGLVLPALAGFLSVSFRGCGMSYAGIIAERAYLVEKNQEQLGATMGYLAVAVVAWGLIVLAGLAMKESKAGTRQQ